MYDIGDVLRVYEGSNGDDTKALYKTLERFGPAGLVAMNLFRAMKCSERAKKYRGRNQHGSYRAQAYERKTWSMNLLAGVLDRHASEMAITWGWHEDPEQEFHRWVLYIDLPTGQVSFHSQTRGVGPEYPLPWDGMRNASADRIIRFVAKVLERTPHVEA